MDVVKWVDNKSVHIITTKNSCDSELTVMRRKKGQAEKATFPCPSVIKEYNTHMGGVDKHDRLTKTNQIDRRSKFRFYLRLAFDFFDQSIVNAQIAWDVLHPEENISSKDFRLAVSKGLVADFSSRERLTASAPVNKKRCVDIQPSRDGLHLPIRIPRARCQVCYPSKDFKTQWGCELCTGGFCMNLNRNCFAEFHHK